MVTSISAATAAGRSQGTIKHVVDRREPDAAMGTSRRSMIFTLPDQLKRWLLVIRTAETSSFPQRVSAAQVSHILTDRDWRPGSTGLTVTSLTAALCRRRRPSSGEHDLVERIRSTTMWPEGSRTTKPSHDFFNEIPGPVWLTSSVLVTTMSSRTAGASRGSGRHGRTRSVSYSKAKVAVTWTTRAERRASRRCRGKLTTTRDGHSKAST